MLVKATNRWTAHDYTKLTRQLQILMDRKISLWPQAHSEMVSVYVRENYRPNHLLFFTKVSGRLIVLVQSIYTCPWFSMLEEKDVLLLLLAVFSPVACVSVTLSQMWNSAKNQNGHFWRGTQHYTWSAW